MRKAIAAAAAVLSLPILAVAPASATDSGAVAQVTDGNNKSTVPAIDGAGDSVIFHTLATDLAGGQGYSGIDNTIVADVSGDPFTYDQIQIDGVFPDISANGNWAVYTVPANGADVLVSQVWRYNLTNNTKVQVTNGNAASGTYGNLAGARVDNNGGVVFQSLATNLSANDPDAASNDSTDGNTGWDVYYWNGTTTTKLTSGAASNYLFPDVAANGSRIVYNSATNGAGGDRTLFSNTAAGNAQTAIANGNGQDELGKVSDDGSVVAFRSDSTNLDGGDSSISVYVWETSGITRVTNLGGSSSVTNPDISGDGAFVAFTFGGEIHRSTVAPAASATLIQISDNTSGAAIDYPSINSDGSMIAYAQSAAGSPPDDVQVYLWDANETVTAPPPPPPGPQFCDFANDPVLNTTFQATTGTNARIARLYAAFFDRNPDPAGYAFWQDRISRGLWTNANAATFFGTSPEFVTTYGSNLSNTEFITLLYNNTLCREPDSGGLTFWLGRMNTGWSKGQVALGFSDAPEFRTRTKTG